MTIMRKKTRNVVVVLSGLPVSSHEFDLKAAYLSRHVPSIGSHYVILEDGDVVKGRDHSRHGNVLPQFNGDSVFIEVMGQERDDVTEAQKTSIQGVVSRMQEIYLDAQELDLTL